MNLTTIPTRAGDAVHVVVESPRGATIKLKYLPELAAFGVSRPLPVGLSYPYDWGFVPQTIGPDGDPIDAMVLWDVPSYPGVVIRCRLLGVIQVEQNAKQGNLRIRNDRILAVPTQAPRMVWRSVADLPARIREELTSFFSAVVAFENKDLAILGWEGPALADELIRRYSK
jgi:inorganic pyrophosphatase